MAIAARESEYFPLCKARPPTPGCAFTPFGPPGCHTTTAYAHNAELVIYIYIYILACGKSSVATMKPLIGSFIWLHSFTRGARSVALGVRVMSNPIISTCVSEYDNEGWRAIPQDHGPDVEHKLTCVRSRGR